jgi:hypothetical protein
MNKKIFLVLIIAMILAGNVFAGGGSDKHKGGDILLGIDLGLGFTPKFFNVFDDPVPEGDYAFTYDFGVNLDYYLFKWLSFNSGLLMHSGFYFFSYESDKYGDKELSDWVLSPVCFTVPMMIHLNIPVVSFLYLGAGLNLNFPVASIINSDHRDTKGEFFLGIPIDLGFDFIKPGRGGSRFFFRITPEIHNTGKPIVFGFMWQIYNFKLYSKKIN